jgi:alpha-N-arabinofuranosidase
MNHEEIEIMTRGTVTMGIVLTALALATLGAGAREYHVSVSGDDGNNGSVGRPLKTISAAARLAQPGDVVTVHAGTYRERIAPPRGGTSNQKRIVYQAAEGEEVVIKGSEVVKGWQQVEHGTWKVTIANDFFGAFNPYSDPIRGDWFNRKGRDHHTGAVYFDGHWLTEAAKLEEVLKPAGDTPLWFGQVDQDNTTIWAQFKGVDPNEAQVEINVRQTVFYPEKPGVNYITVRGFTMMHAATPWAPPTAEQIGLLGTHWSKGWIVEKNDIRYSTCVGVTLGKYGDQWDNTSQNSAEGYVKTIERALENGWSADNIGHHVVRDNEIAHCEQAGLVGSLGAVFSRITGNDIHDIHVRRLFTGAEMGGIKIHAAIDTEIRGNHIYRTHRGIWLDWMAQGARVTRNLLHHNDGSQDLFFEVNHGPFMVDHNVCLSRFPIKPGTHWMSRHTVLDVSQGGAYVHNLFVNGVLFHNELRRDTPYMEAHSTSVGGLRNIPGGDNRFYSNILVNRGFIGYEKAGMPSWIKGNVFLQQAQASPLDDSALLSADFDSRIKLIEKPDGMYLEITLDKSWTETPRPLVTTDLLGKAKVPNLPYLQPDRTPYRLDTDYLGQKRNGDNPFPGPFELPEADKHVLKVWPVFPCN